MRRASATSIDLFTQVLEQEKTAQEQENIPENHLPKSDFSQQDIESFWKEFLTQVQEKDDFTYKAIRGFMVSKLDSNTLKIQYPSESAKAEFEKVSADFFSQFKHKVKHFCIETKYEKLVQKKEIKLTRRKIFEQMANQNPLLHELNSIFNFDLND